MSAVREVSNYDRQRRLTEVEDMYQAAVDKGDVPKAIELGREAQRLRTALAIERTRKYRPRQHR